MAKNRYINTKFWTDDYVATLDPVEKLLYLYLFTNPYVTICGIYELSLPHAGLETGIDKDTIKRILERFEKEKKTACHGGYVFLKNFIKHQSLNPSVIKGIEESLKMVPIHILSHFLGGETDCDRLLQSVRAYQSLSEPATYINSNLNSNFKFLRATPKGVSAPPSPLVTQKPKDKTDGNIMFDLVTWAEDRRGQPFTSRPKQLKAIKMMKTANISPAQIQERWKEMDRDPFWEEKGFDFMNLCNSFNRQKPNE